MSPTAAPVKLIPLICPACQSPLPAKPDELAWVCDTCGKGLLLGGDGQLQNLDIFFSDRLNPSQPGRPDWVARASVTFSERSTYGKARDREAADFWAAPRLFFVPAYAASIEEIVASGVNLLRSPAQVTPGPRARFLPVVTPPDDVRPLAEFIVLSVEADRKDALKTLKFNITLEPPQLWVI